jgi:hypothetical protein
VNGRKNSFFLFVGFFSLINKMCFSFFSLKKKNPNCSSD